MLVDTSFLYSGEGGGDETPVLAPYGTGALTITSFDGTTAYFTSTSGQTGWYTMSSYSLTMGFVDRCTLYPYECPPPLR